MYRHLFLQGVIRRYIFHSYAMFKFLTSLVILDVDYFVLVCRRNRDNIPSFKTILTRTLECPLLLCFNLNHVIQLHARAFCVLVFLFNYTIILSARNYPAQ